MNEAGPRTYMQSWCIRIIILNIVFYFIIKLLMPIGEDGLPLSTGIRLVSYLGLRPDYIIERLYLWQFVTYMFLHGGMLHLFLNMYAVLIFGIPVEQAWGGRRFLIFYFFTGIGAGITIFIVNIILGGLSMQTPTIGASGAVFGLLLAFGILFPDAEILLFFFIPIRAKYLVFLYGGIELYSLIQTGGHSPISHAGHLGGILFGIIYFLIIKKRGISFRSKLLKARLDRAAERREAVAPHLTLPTEIILRNILSKVQTFGPASLTDDEYQFFRYADIMTQDAQKLCVEDDFDPDDPDCYNCNNKEACLVRRIKKYM